MTPRAVSAPCGIVGRVTGQPDQAFDLGFASILGVHAMQPDRRHTMCGFDLYPDRLPFGEWLIRPVTCLACLNAIGAVA